LLLEVGRVVRSHGLSGEVVVELSSNRPERVEPGSRLSIGGKWLRVERARPFGKRWLVSFDEVVSREASEALKGELMMAAPLSDPEALWVHELVGAEVVSTGGESLGKVGAVIANPASDLLELESGGLIPVRFVVGREAGSVVVEVPQGLLG